MAQFGFQKAYLGLQGRLFVLLVSGLTVLLEPGIQTVAGYPEGSCNISHRPPALGDLFNRFYLDQRLQTDLDTCFEDNNPLSLIFLDLDRFKKVNDLRGHPTGDQVLRSVARLLRANIRSQDGWIARYGGDEFVICLPAIDTDTAHRIAERLRLVLASQPLDCGGTDVYISCSIGVHTVTRRSEENTLEDLMKAADKKMYMAKGQGRNIVIS